MGNLSISFHGGSNANSINNILAVTTAGPPLPLLVANSTGSLPALSELRGFFTDTSGNLYVVNAYKDFSNILSFSAPTSTGDPYAFTGVFAAGASDGLAHPFCAVLAPNGYVYVSNQDVLPGKTSSEITYYNGPSMANPGEYQGVFANGFITLRGIATDGTYWYVADEGDSKHRPRVRILDSSGNRQKKSLDIDAPVHLLYNGSHHIYIGSEEENAVYRYHISDGKLEEFITGSMGPGINHTAGLAISGEYIYVASRKSNSVNQYCLKDPAKYASTCVSNLADEPEFLLFL
jgi:hypothetical protein